LRTIARHRLSVDVIGDHGFFPILEREYFQLRGLIALSSVVEGWATCVQKIASLCRQTAVIVRSNRRPCDAIAEAIEINHHSLLRRSCRLAFGLRSLRLA